MAIYRCSVCETIYDEEKEGKKGDHLPKDWACRVCESGKPYFNPVAKTDTDRGKSEGVSEKTSAVNHAIPRPHGDFEIYMDDIHTMSETGQSLIEPMRTMKPTFSWDQILIKGAQVGQDHTGIGHV